MVEREQDVGADDKTPVVPGLGYWWCYVQESESDGGQQTRAHGARYTYIRGMMQGERRLEGSVRSQDVETWKQTTGTFGTGRQYFFPPPNGILHCKLFAFWADRNSQQGGDFISADGFASCFPVCGFYYPTAINLLRAGPPTSQAGTDIYQSIRGNGTAYCNK